MHWRTVLEQRRTRRWTHISTFLYTHVRTHAHTHTCTHVSTHEGNQQPSSYHYTSTHTSVTSTHHMLWTEVVLKMWCLSPVFTMNPLNKESRLAECIQTPNQTTHHAHPPHSPPPTSTHPTHPSPSSLISVSLQIGNTSPMDTLRAYKTETHTHTHTQKMSE